MAARALLITARKLPAIMAAKVSVIMARSRPLIPARMQAPDMQPAASMARR